MGNTHISVLYSGNTHIQQCPPFRTQSREVKRKEGTPNSNAPTCKKHFCNFARKSRYIKKSMLKFKNIIITIIYIYTTISHFSNSLKYNKKLKIQKENIQIQTMQQTLERSFLMQFSLT